MNSDSLESYSLEQLRALYQQELDRRHPQPSLKYSPHQPTEPQRRFLEALRTEKRNAEGDTEPCEVLYGGAAGGGKSDALLMAALEYAHVPGYNALILRRTFADLALPEAIMARAHEWFGPLQAQGLAQWNGTDKRWTFAGGGTITFGYLETENDKYRYQGAAFQFVGFDELTQFTETQYTYLLSRIRRAAEGPISKVPLRCASASNPGGVGHEWVLDYFFTSGRGAFIPAKLSDNPHLDQRSYRAALLKLDAVTRAQLLDGDWAIRPNGPMFNREWFQIVDAPPPHVKARWFRYWDLAGSEVKPGKDPDWTVGTLMALGDDGLYTIADVSRVRARPAGVEALIKQTAEVDGRNIPIVIEQEPGSSGLHTLDHYTRYVLRGWAVYPDRKTGSKVDLARPMSAAAERGLVRLVRGAWNRAWLDEVVTFPLPGFHDDQVDSAAGAMRFLTDGWEAASDPKAMGGRRFAVDPEAKGDGWNQWDTDADDYDPNGNRGGW